MRLANLEGRVVVLLADDLAVDVARASGRTLSSPFDHRPERLFDRWPELVRWAGGVRAGQDALVAVDPLRLGPPVPAPRQVFAFGLNYGDRAREGGLAAATPVVFTKFASCLTGPRAEVGLPTSTVDWELEVVVVIGEQTREITASQAWSRVAGLMIGQDLSERAAQFQPPVPQFSLSKSHPGFGPTGPWLVTPDELDNPDDLALRCELNGELVQSGTTAQMLVSVPELISRLSASLTLFPGDLIFTGTPGGVGHHRTPARYLRPGDRLASSIGGLGHQLVTFR